MGTLVSRLFGAYYLKKVRHDSTVVIPIRIVLTAKTGHLDPKEVVDSLRILPYIIGSKDKMCK